MRLRDVFFFSMAKRRRKRVAIFGKWGKLIRWQNTLVALACVMVALTLGENRLDQPSNLIIYFVVGLIFAGGNVLNDFVDVPSDKIAHPNRPLPAGTIKRKSALLLGISLLTGGIVFDLVGLGYYGLPPTLLAVFAAVLLLFYDFIGSRVPFLGNLVVALLAGTVFIYVGSAQGLTHAHVYAAGFAALITLAREIVKDIADREADESVGIRTLPAVIGDLKAARLASISMVVIVPLSIIPYFTGDFNEWYLAPIILFVVLPVALLAWLLPGNITSYKAKKYAKDMKWIIIGGLLALFLGGITA